MHERHGDRRLHPRHHRDVARVRLDIADHDRLLARNDPADDALVRHQREVLQRRIADRVGDGERVVALVQEIHGERVELEEPANEIRNPLQEFVEFDDRRELTSEIEEREQDLALRRSRPGSLRRLG
jgi:hypothetical protein